MGASNAGGVQVEIAILSLQVLIWLQCLLSRLQHSRCCQQKPQRYAKDNRTAYLTARSDKSVAYVTNNKRLQSTFCTVEAIPTDTTHRAASLRQQSYRHARAETSSVRRPDIAFNVYSFVIAWLECWFCRSLVGWTKSRYHLWVGVVINRMGDAPKSGVLMHTFLDLRFHGQSAKDDQYWCRFTGLSCRL